MTALLYRRVRRSTTAAAISYDQSLITGQIRHPHARPADDLHGWVEVTAGQLKALGGCTTPAQVRALLGGSR